MKKSLIISTFLSAVLVLMSDVSYADLNISKGSSTSSWGPVVKTLEFNKICIGATHDPHYSAHVRGTINVVSNTRCKGRQVSVETHLYLGSIQNKGKHLANSFKSNFSEAITETNWACSIGHTYVVTAISYHVDDRLHSAETLNRATVYCGNFHIKPKPTPKLKK